MMTLHSGCAPNRLLATSTRSRPTHTGHGPLLAMSTGSSPANAGSLSACTGETERALPLYPRLMIAGVYPFRCSRSASQITSGVFPLPPTVMFPTTMTGTGRLKDLNSPILYANRRDVESRMKSHDNGINARCQGPSLCHCLRMNFSARDCMRLKISNEIACDRAWHNALGLPATPRAYRFQQFRPAPSRGYDPHFRSWRADER